MFKGMKLLDINEIPIHFHLSFDICICNSAKFLFQNKWELPHRKNSTETLTRSWADICIPSAGSSIQNFQQVTPIAADHNPLSLQRRRCSYMPPTVTQPLCGERYRTGT